MSERVVRHDFAGATAVPVWTRPVHRGFAAADRVHAGGFSAWVDRSDPADDVAHEDEPAPNPGAESLIQQGYALGLAEGRRVAEAQLAEERAALVRLIDGLEALKPEPPTALAAMLAQSVRRLVAQIVGEVEIDAALLAERVHTVAALVVEEASPARLRVHPADATRLDGLCAPLELTPDPAVAPGTVLAETGSGWIEDGPAVRLEKLRVALDQMGAPR